MTVEAHFWEDGVNETGLNPLNATKDHPGALASLAVLRNILEHLTMQQCLHLEPEQT